MPEAAEIIRNIINVNHAGEYGAIRLYGAQLLVARWLHPDMLAVIQDIRRDEQNHCELFVDVMPAYEMRPCRLVWIWAVAAGLLGFATPLLGRRALLMSIKAAEDTAHEHLGAQVEFLKPRDERLAAVIAQVQAEEQRHVSVSVRELGAAQVSGYETLVYRVVYQLCQATMWVVTRGASARLKQVLATSPAY